MDVGLIIASTFFVTAGLSLLVWYAGSRVIAWKKEVEKKVSDVDSSIVEYVKRIDYRLDRHTLAYRTSLAEVVQRVYKIEEQLKEAQVVRLDAKTGAFLHTPESEAAAEKEAGIGEPIQIGAAKPNGKRHEFATLGGIDAFDKPTMEEVSDNAGKEAERTRQDQ